MQQPDHPELVGRDDEGALNGRRAQRLLEQWNWKPTPFEGTNRRARRGNASFGRHMRGAMRAEIAQLRTKASKKKIDALRCPR